MTPRFGIWLAEVEDKSVILLQQVEAICYSRDRKLSQ
jgi:hypothetical protein